MAARGAIVVVCVLATTACGSDKPSAYAKENIALLARVPVYPGASAPKTSAGTASSTEFGARDWTLPAGTRPERVIDWYIATLQSRGWRVTGKSFNTIRATRRNASLSVGVRKRTVEVIANSRGA